MPSETDPSAITITPTEVNKMSKKDLAKYLRNLQDTHVELGKKYGK
jgi:hypothetical protein